MRLSNQSHTLAVLRLRAGLTQKEMAAVLHCSAPTIQAVELGRLKLSEKLAGLASLRTGINLAWLLENDVTKPPVDIKGRPYTKAIFEEYQAIADIKKVPPVENDLALLCRDQTLNRLHGLLLRAFQDNNTELCAYKVSKAFDELEKQFHVTGADRKAACSAEHTPELGAKMTKEEKESFKDWGNYMIHFYRVLDREEKKKITDRKMKPMSLAEQKRRNIKRVQLDDQGQLIVERFFKTKPINTKPE